MKTARVHFLGGVETVTGSKFLIETEGLNVLVDCGMFQGLKELRKLNWEPLPVDVSNIDVVLLTHGHLDHVGYLPRLVRQGFTGKILGTAPTLAITEIILKDSAKINEEEAKKANDEGYSEHTPALPFYTMEEAENTRLLFETVGINESIFLSDQVASTFRYNGHILGATFIELTIGEKLFVFSGDIGRENDLLLYSPDKPRWADYLFVESTYGNRIHKETLLSEKIIRLVKEVITQKGILIIPAFAVERMQTILFLLWELYQKNSIPNIPIYIDSPMGNDVLSLFATFTNWHKLNDREVANMINRAHLIISYRDTWKTIDNPQPKIVIAGSGMITGGRVLTYLQQFIDEPSAQILLVGYQAEGTRGRQLIEGADEVKFFGKHYPVKAKIHQIESLSAHADQNEIINWLSDIKNVPEEVFLIHGDALATDTLRAKIENQFHWNVHIPTLYETVDLQV
ncbi:MAG: MBL fold metallo-hydrolase [Bacteroidetes bacterium]|nr:MBL fold metallo-hydrolase [Bacteroidota bacterium]